MLSRDEYLDKTARRYLGEDDAEGSQSSFHFSSEMIGKASEAKYLRPVEKILHETLEVVDGQIIGKTEATERIFQEVIVPLMKQINY